MNNMKCKIYFSCILKLFTVFYYSYHNSNPRVRVNSCYNLWFWNVPILTSILDRFNYPKPILNHWTLWCLPESVDICFSEWRLVVDVVDKWTGVALWSCLGITILSTHETDPRPEKLEKHLQFGNLSPFSRNKGNTTDLIIRIECNMKSNNEKWWQKGHGQSLDSPCVQTTKWVGMWCMLQKRWKP